MRYLNRATRLVVASDRTTKENYIRIGIFLAVIATVVTAFMLRNQFTPEQWGYGGVALSSLVASAGFILPIPALGAVCVSIGPPLHLNPLFTGLIAGSAEALGELTGYFLGYTGRAVISRTRIYQKLEGWMDRRGWMLLFLVSIVPNPIFDVIGVAAGALRYPLWRFLAVVWAGKLIKFITFAYACSYSIEWLTGLFGQ
ncbi:MAG: hypothetical protein BZY88_11000 [SAR202 cluster bacterium Io17-Chloro-G9]|nr:MAG: hypothetical protein BZY88_11000 [SAR202 cluster bacterium Io17-Chloro-G9]